MKKADAVIGANFGDEGKGLVTDFLSSGLDAVVVRHNGGAQAGHTVTAPDGRRHVFSHFGSGSFAGAHTFLSRFFVCNPLLFAKEYAVLREKSVHPVVYVDSKTPVTTPYDMMVNQIVEEQRGHGRHGSCGLGFGETIERQQHAAFILSYNDLFNQNELKKKLQAIRQEWMPKRLVALGVNDIPAEWQDRISGGGVLNKYLEDTQFFLQETKKAADSYLADTRRKIVFEGAQGLLLDQDRGCFPHVTRSHTGIRNIAVLAEEAGIDELNAAYITRAYMTRHGAGPLSHELGCVPYARVKDETNVPNAWQGTLRFGWLDADFLGKTIADDLSDHRGSFKLNHGLAVTCLDQVDDQVTFVDGGIRTSSKDDFLGTLKERVGAGFVLISEGATRGHVMPDLFRHPKGRQAVL